MPHEPSVSEADFSLILDFAILHCVEHTDVAKMIELQVLEIAETTSGRAIVEYPGMTLDQALAALRMTERLGKV